MVRDWEQLLHVLEDIERERVIDRLTSIDEADEDLYCGLSEADLCRARHA